jgi:hypothetical protein
MNVRDLCLIVFLEALLVSVILGILNRRRSYRPPNFDQIKSVPADAPAAKDFQT